MQAYPILLEAFTLKLRVAAPHADGRARADVISKIWPVVDLGHAKLWQQATVKFMRLVELTHR